MSLQNSIDGNGILYQWQSSADGITYLDEVGAISATYTATPSGTTYYQCLVTCPFGPAMATSTPVQVTFSNTAPSTTPVTICDPGVASLKLQLHQELSLGMTLQQEELHWLQEGLMPNNCYYNNILRKC